MAAGMTWQYLRGELSVRLEQLEATRWLVSNATLWASGGTVCAQGRLEGLLGPAQ